MRGKPGTIDEQKRKAAMRELGCIACILDGKPRGECYEDICEIHHMLRGNKKMGEWATVPLCAPHHTEGPLSWHRHRRAFRDRYDSDLMLIRKTNDELARRGLYP